MKKKVLGKGLEALIPTTAPSGSEFKSSPGNKISKNNMKTQNKISPPKEKSGDLFFNAKTGRYEKRIKPSGKFDTAEITVITGRRSQEIEDVETQKPSAVPPVDLKESAPAAAEKESARWETEKASQELPLQAELPSDTPPPAPPSAEKISPQVRIIGKKIAARSVDYKATPSTKFASAPKKAFQSQEIALVLEQTRSIARKEIEMGLQPVLRQIQGEIDRIRYLEKKFVPQKTEDEPFDARKVAEDLRHTCDRMQAEIEELQRLLPGGEEFEKYYEELGSRIKAEIKQDIIREINEVKKLMLEISRRFASRERQFDEKEKEINQIRLLIDSLRNAVKDRARED